MTSGQTHCGVTKKEYFDIQSLCSGDPLEDEMMAVLDATYDQTMGARPHSISLARFDKYASYDKRLGGQILNDLMNGKLRFFTKAIGDAATRILSTKLLQSERPYGSVSTKSATSLLRAVSAQRSAITPSA